MCSHSDANVAKSEHMAHIYPCCHHLQPRFCLPARLQLANSHNLIAGIGFVVDSSRVLPLPACMCSIMNAPVFTFGRYPRNFRQKVSIPGCAIRSLLNGWITSMEWPRFREAGRQGQAQQTDYAAFQAAASRSRFSLGPAPGAFRPRPRPRPRPSASHMSGQDMRSAGSARP